MDTGVLRLPSRKPDNTPGGLAAELAEAKRAYEAKRNDVIERGVTRQHEIAELQNELAREQAELEQVVRSA